MTAFWFLPILSCGDSVLFILHGLNLGLSNNIKAYFLENLFYFWLDSFWNYIVCNMYIKWYLCYNFQTNYVGKIPKNLMSKLRFNEIRLDQYQSNKAILAQK